MVGLSKRQLECFQAVSDFDGDFKKAAESLQIGVCTLKKHCNDAYLYFDTHTYFGAIKRLVLMGLVELR